MPELIHKSTSVVKTINKEKRQLTIMASTKQMDRDNEIIMPRAFKNTIDQYLKNNPIILPSHNYRADSIGKAVDAKITSDGLEMTIEFAPTEEGQRYWTLYEGGYQRSFSVGFRPKKFKDITEDSIKDDVVEWEDGDEKFSVPYQNGLNRVFTEIELLEVSTCAIPCNPGAVSRLELDAAKHEFLALKEFIEKEEKAEKGEEGDVVTDPPEDMEGKIKVTCPKCGASVNVPKGGSAKCSKCGATVSDKEEEDDGKGKEAEVDDEGNTYIMIDQKQIEKITTIITDGIEKVAQILENQTVIGKLVEDINEKVISVGNIVAELKPKETSGDEGKLKEEVTALKQMLDKMQSLTQK